VKLSEADIKSFSDEQENVNTKKKTLYDLKLFKKFLASEDERRELQEIPAAELQQFAIKFLMEVRKKNGEEYEPSSLSRGFCRVSTGSFGKTDARFPF